MAKDRLHLDYETYSELDLSDVGSSRYARHESTEILMGAWSLNDKPQDQWVPAEGEPIPRLLKEALVDPDVQKWAWNAPFEMNITEQHVGPVDVSQWRCTMALALTCSLPGKLEKAGPVVDLDEDKLKDPNGRRLMRKFSSPQRATKKMPERRILWWQDYWE